MVRSGSADGPPTVIVDRLQGLGQRPDRELFRFLVDGEVDSARSLSAHQLLARSNGVARALRQAAIEPGSRALLLYPPGLDFPSAFFGCLVAGVVAVPAPAVGPQEAGRADGRIQSIVRSANPAAVLAPAALLGLREAMRGALASVPWIATDQVQPAETLASTPHELAYLQYTSGSTSRPRGVRIRHENLLQNCIANGADRDDAYGFDAHSTVVSWVPVHHDLGLVYGVVMPVFTGGRSVLMDPRHFVQRPMRWLTAMHRCAGTHSVSPDFGFELSVRKTTVEARQGLDLGRWRVALNGAEPIRRSTEAAFIEAYGPHGFRAEALSHAYGLSEATAKVSAERPWRRGRFAELDAAALAAHRILPAGEGTRRTVACCGAPGPGMSVAIVVDGAPAAADTVGEVWLQGESVSDGYFEDAAATEVTFGARLSGRDGPWLRTGDLGFVRDGALYITGRLKDVIIVRGQNHYPQDLEWAAAAQPHIRPGGVAAFSVPVDGAEGVVLVAEVTGDAVDADALFASLREAVGDLGLQATALGLLPAKGVPRTSSGKVQRALARQRWLDGSLGCIEIWEAVTAVAVSLAPRALSEVLTDPGADRHAVLLAHLCVLFGAEARAVGDAADPDESVSQLGIDSIRVIELGERVARDVGLSLYPSVVQDHPTPRALTQFILGRLR